MSAIPPSETLVLVRLNDVEALTLCGIIEAYRLMRGCIPSPDSSGETEQVALNKLEQALLTSGAFTREQYRELMEGFLSAMREAPTPRGHPA